MNLEVVLVGTQFAENLGSVARACTNFGVDRLKLVGSSVDPSSDAAARAAVGEAPKRVLARIERFATLPDALADTVASVAYTRRTRSDPVAEVGPALDELRARLSEGARVALVFGREESGLTKAEVAACTHLCSFRTHATNPSLNLSHAVCVALFASRSAVGAGPQSPGCEPAVHSETAAAVSHFEALLRDAGTVQAGSLPRMVAHFERVVKRAGATSEELGALRAAFSKVQLLLGNKNRVH